MALLRRTSVVDYSYARMVVNDNLLVVYPQAGNALYEVLARRLVTACAEKSRIAELCPASAVCELDKGHLSDTVVMVIQPAQCYIHLADEHSFSQRISEARKRLVVAAESVGTIYFERQFELPINFDAMIDVGFVSQASKLAGFETPYYFLFNGPTREEKRAIEQTPASARAIPWTLVGHDRIARVELAYELTNWLQPGGVVFLPPAGVVIKERNGTIVPDGLHRLLGRTQFYVWTSLHDFDYYESFRFREAILAGAAPCKIDSRTDWKYTGIPGIFSSVETFAECVHNEGFESLLGKAKDYYLSRGLLADQLERVLDDV